MTRRLHRRELGPLAAGVLAGLCIPSWAQEEEGAGAAPPAKAKPPTAVDLAVEWLARHQSSDGRWSSSGFAVRCSGQVCDGPGQFAADLRASGLALQLFLAFGETHQSGTYKGAVREGIKYLRNVQAEDGGFGARSAPWWWSSHMSAAQALVETYGMTQSEVVRPTATRGLEFTLAAMDPAKGFRSEIRDVAPDAVSVAELAVLVHAASLANLIADPRPALDACLAWFAERTDPKTGAVRAGEPESRPDPLADDDRATCAGLVRMLCPADVEAVRADALIGGIADRLASKPPAWAPAPKGRMRFSAWQRRTMFLHQVGGENHLAWNRRLTKLLVERQRLDGCARGSYDPADVDGEDRGRVESTAMCGLAATWPYRWQRRLDRPKPEDEAAPPK